MILTDKELRTVCIEVTEFDEVLVRTVKLMFKKMHKWGGIGLAANQVGIPKQIFVMQVDKKYVVINPKMDKFTAEGESGIEGCLSLPGQKAEITRRKYISIHYTDEYGKSQEAGFKGLEARCVQHELDHLNGKLCMDRIL